MNYIISMREDHSIRCHCNFSFCCILQKCLLCCSNSSIKVSNIQKNVMSDASLRQKLKEISSRLRKSQRIGCKVMCDKRIYFMRENDRIFMKESHSLYICTFDLYTQSFQNVPFLTVCLPLDFLKIKPYLWLCNFVSEKDLLRHKKYKKN